MHAPGAGNGEDLVSSLNARALSDAKSCARVSPNPRKTRKQVKGAALARGDDAQAAEDEEEAVALSCSNAMAFPSLRWSPSLTMYVLGVYREKSRADTRARASLLCPPG